MEAYYARFLSAFVADVLPKMNNLVALSFTKLDLKYGVISFATGLSAAEAGSEAVTSSSPSSSEVVENNRIVPILEELTLDRCNIDCQGAKALAEGLRLGGKTLRRLILPTNRIDDMGAKCLGRAFKDMEMLEEVNLKANFIRRSGYASLLSALSRAPKIKRWELPEPVKAKRCVTLEGVDFSQMHNLEKLCLTPGLLQNVSQISALPNLIELVICPADLSRMRSFVESEKYHRGEKLDSDPTEPLFDPQILACSIPWEILRELTISPGMISSELDLLPLFENLKPWEKGIFLSVGYI